MPINLHWWDAILYFAVLLHVFQEKVNFHEFPLHLTTVFHGICFPCFSYLTVTFVTETMATANALLRTEVCKKVVGRLYPGQGAYRVERLCRPSWVSSTWKSGGILIYISLSNLQSFSLLIPCQRFLKNSLSSKVCTWQVDNHNYM